MARRKTYKTKKKSKKKETRLPETGKEALTVRARLGKLVETKEDVYKLEERFGPLKSFWCEKCHCWINMISCIHRKYVFKYHDECNKCTQIFGEFAGMLGDKVEDLWEE